MGANGSREKKTAVATFAAGCFWSKEYFLSRQKGVLKTRVGFTGGHTLQPTYKEVCGKQTGHAEAVEVTYDPDQTSFAELVRYFFNMHDPSVDRTDRGGQYRSAIFFHNEDQLAVAKKGMQQLSGNGFRVVTTLEPAGTFWPAEARHQKYCEARGMSPQDRFTNRVDSASKN